ncbi:hypothetical protein IHV25_06030 [Phaeovibrio sulfidiphilus]|uniref:Uncharacterized protein n=1 Tax=Phaeovibrio sulfidiphilus TaxID=1220600 RepID=A0A8J6YMJ4_9PROT|nr:hypothetical protein [Phaeovibrio sulfidiphilus]MBE1237205.1 hypothetical protein [Phaeovibrio sulfidiphilus]
MGLVTVNIPDALEASLVDAAILEGRTKDALVAEAVEKYLAALSSQPAPRTWERLTED